MNIVGEYRVRASRQDVWDALNDPEIIGKSLPGCEEIEKASPTEWSAKVRTRIGPVSATFRGKVTLSELDPPNGYRISGEGSGGSAGFAKGGAHVRLSDQDDGTLLAYKVDAQIGGKLAQIGSRLIDSTARKLADEFFGRFTELVESGQAPAASADPAPNGIDGADGRMPEPEGMDGAGREGIRATPAPQAREAAGGKGFGPWAFGALILAAAGVAYVVTR